MGILTQTLQIVVMHGFALLELQMGFQNILIMINPNLGHTVMLHFCMVVRFHVSSARIVVISNFRSEIYLMVKL